MNTGKEYINIFRIISILLAPSFSKMVLIYNITCSNSGNLKRSHPNVTKLKTINILNYYYDHMDSNEKLIVNTSNKIYKN